MKMPWLGGLVVGLLVGVVATAAVSLLLRNGPEPEPPPVPAFPVTAPDPGTAEETRQLRKRIVELESKLAEAGKPKEPLPPAPAEPPVDLDAEFRELAGKGLNAYAGKDFKAFIEKVKAAGRKGLDFLVETLLDSASGTERFMAAAALEALKNPNAIPALATALSKDGDAIVRRMASHALALIGTDAAEAPLRAAMSSDADWGVRGNAAYGLAKMGHEDGLLHLERTYASDETPAEYRLAILGGLSDVAAPSTAPLFRRILNESTDAGYQILSIQALAKMKDAASIPELERIANSDAPSFVKEAAQKAVEATRE